MKRILADIRSIFPSERRLFVTESLSWVALFLFFTSLPLFTERHLLSYIPIALGCLFALLAFLYMLFAKKLYFPVFFAFMLFFIVYAFALTCFTTKDWNSLKTMFSVLSLAAVVVEFLLLSGKPKWGLYAYAYSGIIFAIALLIDSIPTLPGRIGSTFGNINSIALYLSTWAVSFLALSLLGQSKKRFLYLIGAFIGLALVLLTGSRGGLLSFAFSALGFIFFAFGRKRWPFALLTCLGIALIGVIVLSLIPDLAIWERIGAFFSTLFGYGTTDGSVATRLNMFKDAISLFGDNAIFGYGLGGFNANTSYFTYSHATITELLVSTGLIGTSSYLCFLGFGLNRSKFKAFAVLFILLAIPNFFFGVVYISKYFVYFFCLAASFKDESPLFDWGKREKEAQTAH